MKRSEILENLKTKKYDLLIIGGGITGAGIALDAISRGLSVGLVEKGDFASGTSSKSTKLIHGGLRYLKQLDFALVHEVGSERAVLRRLAPNLVKPERMLLPLYQGGTYSYLLTLLGLTLYDLLAGVKKPERKRMLSKSKTLEYEPLLKAEKLKGSGLYYEYRTDDARLTIEIIKTAVKKGADCLNYCELLDFDYDDLGNLSFAKCIDKETGEEILIEAELIVNAAGPWVDKLRLKQQPENTLKKTLHLTKGVHLVVERKRFPITQSIYFDEAIKKRMIFAIPRGDTTYFGTTDTDYDGDLDNVVVEEADIEYLLAAVNHAFPSINLSPADIKSSWAGLRPLIHEAGKGASELSRKDEIFISPDGLISIAGGKLTGYRKMAERVVDKVVKTLKSKKLLKTFTRSKTVNLQLDACAFVMEDDEKDSLEKFLSPYFNETIGECEKSLSYYVLHLLDNYGLDSYKVLDYFKNLLIERKELSRRAAFILAEFQYCIDYEYARKPEDFWERRSGYLYFEIDTVREFEGLIALEFAKMGVDL